MNKIYILTSSRADYGFYKPLLKEFISQNIEFEIIAFGTHLSEKHGYTLDAILNDGYKVEKKIQQMPVGDTPYDISLSIAKTISEFSSLWRNVDPQNTLILCLGDRFEMFAAVSASWPFNIPIAHISGGEETTGSIDNFYRHAMTLMASTHFANTQKNAERIKSLIGDSKNVYVTGSLAIDNIVSTKLYSMNEFESKYGFDIQKPYILTTYHPETVNYNVNEKNMRELVKTFDSNQQLNFLVTMPNSDTNNSIIRMYLSDYAGRSSNVFLVENLGSEGYYTALKHCKLVLGNSSSGIVESASFAKYAINLGDRQKGRERDINVIDCEANSIYINSAIHSIERKNKLSGFNIYGEGNSAKKITGILTGTDRN